MALNAQQSATINQQLLIATLDVRLKSDILTFVLSRKRLKWIKSYFLLKMEINKEKIRYILQYHYDKGKNAAQACEKIRAIYGEDTLSKSATVIVRSLSCWKFRCER